MATAQKTTLSIVTANTTAHKTAPRKPAAKKATIPAKWNPDWIPSIATYAMAMATSEKALKSAQDSVNSARENIERVLGQLRSAGIKIGGSQATCAIAKELFVAFIANGMKESSARNALTGARDTVNSGLPFNLNPGRAKAQARKDAENENAGKGNAGKGNAGKGNAGKGKPGTTWKTPAEVADALAIAINNVKQKAGKALWEKALATGPDGFDFAIADFLEMQGEETK